MAEEENDEAPKKRRKGKGFFTRRRILIIFAIIFIFAAGAAFQHYFLEPLYGETVAEKYSRCLNQKELLNDRFAECENLRRACEFQLNECQAR